MKIILDWLHKVDWKVGKPGIFKNNFVGYENGYNYKVDEYEIKNNTIIFDIDVEETDRCHFIFNFGEGYVAFWDYNNYSAKIFNGINKIDINSWVIRRIIE